MKLPRVLILTTLAASIASAAAAQTISHWGPQPISYQYTYYTDVFKTQLVSINSMSCDGTEVWQGYNGNPDLTISIDYDYVESEC